MDYLTYEKWTSSSYALMATLFSLSSCQLQANHSGRFSPEENSCNDIKWYNASHFKLYCALGYVVGCQSDAFRLMLQRLKLHSSLFVL